MTEQNFQPKVEPGIPIPEPRDNARNSSKFPEFHRALKSLAVGDSFWYPGDYQTRPVKNASRSAKDYGIRIRMRKRKENGTWGTRIWRIE